MQGIQSWCYTLFAGVLFSGIVLMLTPDERYRPLMRVILGGFLLVCMVTWVGQINVKIDFSAGDAERQREQTMNKARPLLLVFALCAALWVLVVVRWLI